MKHTYEFPDDPEVFARVLQQFRNRSVDYWEARMASYASEARKESSVTTAASGDSVSSREPKITTAVAHARRSKRKTGTVGK